MSDKESSAEQQGSEPEKSPGPNLALVYGLVGAAFLIAMIIAAFIVLPFYRHR